MQQFLEKVFIVFYFASYIAFLTKRNADIEVPSSGSGKLMEAAAAVDNFKLMPLFHAAYAYFHLQAFLKFDLLSQ